MNADARYLNYKTVRGLLYHMKTSSRSQGVSKSEAKKIQSLLKKAQHELNVDVINDFLDKYHLEKITPIYSTEEVEQSLTFFDGYPYNQSISIGKEMSCSFYDAVHILGSSITAIRANENGRSVNVRTIC